MARRSCQRRDEDWTLILSDTSGTPTDSTPTEALYFQLFNEIGIISQLSSSAFEKALPHGLTAAQFGVLNHCVRLGDGQTPARLAAAFQVTRGTMTSTLSRLESKGFIRTEPDPKDGRSKRVYLTEAGKTAREDGVAAAAPLFRDVTGALDRAQAEALLQPLQALRKWLDENRNTDFDGL